ncbi:arsenosugar biosynthesis arsenite methyltransferase ArsM [Sporomusa aerivorans]|uniref:arsenosugar biosynthesis arsenite methyltransferase ArsM n=1 Tax=Sporomusa aerivorans TaxID=204936 RepID=UPI00352AF877
MSYLTTVHEVYKEAALTPQASLCCISQQNRFLPGLIIPDVMSEMNYGCGTTVHFGELNSRETILYVGVGGGLEALQFAYFTRRPHSVIAVDRVPEMLKKARENFIAAEKLNPWFCSEFIDVKEGDARRLPVNDESVDVAAQNCLFNIFEGEDLMNALREIHRVLKPGGRVYISDPITTLPIPEQLRQNERLRAMCLSGALEYGEYLDRISGAGFGRIEVRARRPYRVLDKERYSLEYNILLESLEIVAYKAPVPADGARVFAGETVIYFGRERLRDEAGCIIPRDIPHPVCQKSADYFRKLNRDDLIVTAPTYHCSGAGGCC